MTTSGRFTFFAAVSLIQEPVAVRLTKRSNSRSTAALIPCGDYFTACKGYDTSDCYLEEAPDQATVDHCNADLHASFNGFKWAPHGSHKRREYMLGGLAGQTSKPTCRTGLYYNSVGGTTNSCPVPLPPPTSDIKTEHESFSIYTIGDWGPTGKVNCWACPGVNKCKTSMWVYEHHHCPPEGSKEWNSVENAQLDVATMMGKQAEQDKPVAVINVGDNFYFGGIGFPEQHPDQNSAMTFNHGFFTTWSNNYLKHEGLKVPWISCLGNHDYGGAGCLSDWMSQIDYSKFDKTKSWVMPAQWFKQRISGPSYDVEIFVNEMNYDDALIADGHGICFQSLCKKQSRLEGNRTACNNRFQWGYQANMKWLDLALAQSTAHWKILVGHFITGPTTEKFLEVAHRHGVNLYVAGHEHNQHLYHAGCCHSGAREFCGFESCTIPRLLTGGGGGIGLSGSYFGFYRLQFTKDHIMIDLHDNNGAHIPQQSGNVSHNVTDGGLPY